MCNSPIRILLAEDALEDTSLIISLVAQFPSQPYQLELVKTYDAVLKSLSVCLSAQQWDVYLVDSRLIQLEELELFRRSLASTDAVIIVLIADLDETSAYKSSGFVCLPKAELTPAILKQTIEYGIDRSQLLANIDRLLQQHNELTVALETLKKCETQLGLAFQGTDDGLWDWNLETNEIFFSSQWKAMLGYQDSEVTSQPDAWFKRIHPEDLYWVKRQMTDHLDGICARFESEYRMLNRDGNYCRMLGRGKAVRNGTGQVVRIVGTQMDLTNLKRNEERLLHDALYDPLTGLPNRISLMERLRHASELANRKPGYLFSVLFIDLDRFKIINDSLGHILGDELLSEISHRLANCLRPNDTVARLSGDEFVVLLEDVKNHDNVLMVTQRILQELSTPFNLEGQEIFTSASIGITFSNCSLNRPEDLLRDADLAMHLAKTQGRGRYEIFHPRLHTSALARLQLENDLRRAVEREELKLYYQPIVSLRTNRLVGFEALIRWHHPQEGLISPTRFIPIAEETGLILPIGWWILREACTQLKQWQKQFPDLQPLTVNVNLSGKQFSPALVEGIQQILTETQLAPEHLKLEITESMLMSHADSAITTLTQLKQLGTQLAIDDFGTGYSSLSYLHRFPIDTLKIDRSFIQRVDADGEQLAIVRTIITLAWNLGMEVVAEGVETSKQLTQLRSLRCEYAQGYFFSQPRDSQAIEDMLLYELDQGYFKPYGLPKV